MLTAAAGRRAPSGISLARWTLVGFMLTGVAPQPGRSPGIFGEFVRDAPARDGNKLGVKYSSPPQL